MKVVKHGSEAWVLRSTGKDLLCVFLQNSLQKVFECADRMQRVDGTKCDSISLSSAIMSERLR